MKSSFIAIFMMALLSTIAMAQTECQPDCTPVTVINTAITSNTTLDNNQVYRIDGCIIVSSGVTLTIQPGAVITFDDGDFLIIQKGATIDAEGTEECPITFTSTAAPGMRVPINAGVIIAGEGILNESPLTLPCGTHTTGNNNTDNSGVLRYARFSYLSGSDNLPYMANGLSLIGVGSQTEIDHIEISHSATNGLAILGGAPQVRNVFALNNEAAQVYFSLGTVAEVQTLLTVNKALSNTGVGMLVENNSTNTTALPLTQPTVSNFSLLGSSYCNTGLDEYGILFQNNAAGDFYNGFVSGFDYGIYIEDVATAQNTASDLLNVSYSSFTGNGILDYEYNTININWPINGCSFSMADWIENESEDCSETGNQFGSFDPKYHASFCEDYCDVEFIPNFVLIPPVPLELQNPDYSELDLSFFDQLTYRGAIQATEMFKGEWIDVCPLNTVYCADEVMIQSQAPTMNIYPNPANAITNLSFDTELPSGIAEVRVMEMVTGRVLYRKSVRIQYSGEQLIPISVEGWKEGVYPVMIQLEDKVIHGKLNVR